MAGWKWRFWATLRELRRAGVLGINRRNGDYVLLGNPRAHFPRVDDKLLTKRICEAHGIPVPETYAAIERHGDIRKFLELIPGRQQFVIKPGRGSEGRGIVVVAEHDGAEFITAGGQRLGLADVRYHLSTILSGLYSLGGQPDCAIVEQRIVRHAVFERIAVGGTPDVRIVLYRGVPVMAMVRLPTRESRGRANLHQGAIAAAIHLGRGLTYGGVCRNRAVSVHPDTGATIEGLEIPFWNELLAAAMKLAEAVELGYLGVDFVLDAAVGPVILEANARPGLAIQVANRRGLLPRLQWIDRQSDAMLAPDRRLELIAQVAELQ
jgi:alpha-L-glutamate ligase-like protein